MKIRKLILSTMCATCPAHVILLQDSTGEHFRGHVPGFKDNFLRNSVTFGVPEFTSTIFPILPMTS